jgi:hypothetical protein
MYGDALFGTGFPSLIFLASAFVCATSRNGIPLNWLIHQRGKESRVTKKKGGESLQLIVNSLFNLLQSSFPFPFNIS